jgi:hypothetical protein
MIEATAIITEVRGTGAKVDQTQHVRLTLNIQPACGEPWETTKKIAVSRLNIPRVGDPIRVRYFENARDGLAVQRRYAADFAAAADAGIPRASAP